MSRILKILLFVIGIIVVFEVGLFASYTLISPSSSNPDDLLSVQMDSINEFISSLTGEETLTQQDSLNVTNKADVGLVLNDLTNLSVNINSLSAKISTSDTGNQTVTLTAIATKDTQSTSGGAIQILSGQSYSITASATGEVYSSGKVSIDTDTIKVTEQIVLYDQNGTANANDSDIDNLVQYSQNGTNGTNDTNSTNGTNASNGSSNASNSSNTSYTRVDRARA